MKPLMERNPDHRPWGLILVLSLAAVAGILSIPLQVIAVRSINAASQADVRRAAELTQQLAEQQRVQDEQARVYREDTRLLILSLCAQVEGIGEQTGLMVEPCPRVETDPPLLPSAGP